MHNNKLTSNLINALTGNIISFITSFLVVTILPKFMTIESYGYWQLYLFYLSYVGFFHFGWIGGIHLRYAGFEYRELNKPILAGQFYAMMALEVAIAVSAFIYAYLSMSYPLSFIIQMISIVGLSVIITTFVSYTLQSVNEIKVYSRIIILEQVAFLIMISIYMAMDVPNYVGLICISFVSKLATAIYSLYLIRAVIFVRLGQIVFRSNEMYENISVGIKFMLADISSMLILGIVRLGISQGWNIVTFGKVSLMLSISNFMMIFINAIGIVIFPIIKREDPVKLPEIYSMIRAFLSVVLLGIFILYYPLIMVISYWLPQYADTIKYMAVFFPICLFESKTSLLINTYLKSLRQEFLMLKITFYAMIASLFCTYFSVTIRHSLELAVLSILLVFAFRLATAEYFLGKILDKGFHKEFINEVVLVTVFVVSNWYLNIGLSMTIYLVAYMLYLSKNRKYVTCFYNKIYR